MIGVWIEVAKICLFGFIIGIGVGFFLAWDIDKERVRENFKKKWEPILMDFMERYD